MRDTQVAPVRVGDAFSSSEVPCYGDEIVLEVSKASTRVEYSQVRFEIAALLNQVQPGDGPGGGELATQRLEAGEDGLACEAHPAAPPLAL